MLWYGNECGRSNEGLKLSPVQIMIDQKQLENVEYFNCLGNVITYDARCTCEIKSRIAVVNAAFNKKEALFHQQTGLKFKEKWCEE
jgi:hypothetical protein